MQTEDSYSSGHLVLSYLGYACLIVKTNLSEICHFFRILNFEHRLAFTLYVVYSYTLVGLFVSRVWYERMDRLCDFPHFYSMETREFYI